MSLRSRLKDNNSPFVSRMALLLTGTAASAALGFAATPLLSRLYSPGEFGILGVFTAALSLFSVVATLRYDRAIPSATDEAEAASIMSVALATVLFTSLTCCILVLSGALSSVVSAARGHERLLAWALPVGMAAAGTYDALSFWMVRRLDYRTLSITKVSQGVSMVGSQVVLGILHVGAVGLVVGQIAGSSMGLVRLGRRTLGYDREAFAKVGWMSMRSAANDFRRFPLLSSPAVLMDALTGALPTLVIAHRFGAVPAGVLTIVTRVVQAPLSLIITNLGQIFFGELAALRRTHSQSLLSLFLRRLRQVVPVGLLLVGGMALVVPYVLPIALGPRWGDATTYFLIMAPAIFAGFVSSPFGVGIDVLRRQDLHFLRDATRALVLIALLAAAYWYHMDVLHTIGMISIAGCINGIVYLAVCWYGFAADGRQPDL